METESEDFGHDDCAVCDQARKGIMLSQGEYRAVRTAMFQYICKCKEFVDSHKGRAMDNISNAYLMEIIEEISLAESALITIKESLAEVTK